MPYCTNCGGQIKKEAKFCSNCGCAKNSFQSNAQSERKTVYEGNLHKCPNCGEILPSFITNCTSCGCELRGTAAVNSVRELYLELHETNGISKRDILIRNFPIPNSKEDILEFMILASSNILGEDDRKIYEAWIAKFEQVYQKATLLFNTDDDFTKIQQIYNNCQVNIIAERQRRRNKIAIDTAVRNIAVCVGILLTIIAIIIDRSGGNASLMEITAYIVLISSAASLFKRKAIIIDYIVGAVSGILAIILSFLLHNRSVGELCGAIVLIIAAVNYFKSLNKSN